MKVSNVFAVGLGLGIVSGVFLGLGMGRQEAMDDLDSYKEKLNKANNALENLAQYNKGVVDGLDIAKNCKEDEAEEPHYPFGRVVAVPTGNLGSILEHITKEGLRDFAEVEVEEMNCDECPVSPVCDNAK